MISRDQFEAEYIIAHLYAMPRDEAKISLVYLRNNDYYDDEHVNSCWFFYKLGFESGKD